MTSKAGRALAVLARASRYMTPGEVAALAEMSVREATDALRHLRERRLADDAGLRGWTATHRGVLCASRAEQKPKPKPKPKSPKRVRSPETTRKKPTPISGQGSLGLPVAAEAVMEEVKTQMTSKSNDSTADELDAVDGMFEVWAMAAQHADDQTLGKIARDFMPAVAQRLADQRKEKTR